MFSLTGTTRKYVIIGAAVLAIILGLVLIYVQYSALSSLRAEVEEEELLVDTARSNLDRLLVHRDRAEEYERRLQFAGEKIPTAAGEDQFLRYLHRLSEQHGLEAVNISFAERVAEENYTAMPVSITLEGSFSSIRKLLADLRNGERAVRVDNLSFSRAEGGSDLQVSISASAFYRP